MKTIFLSLTLLLLLSGCGEKKEQEQASESAAVATSSGIEVSKNEDAYKEKVKAQEVDKNKEKSFYYDYQTEEKAEKTEKAEEAKPRTVLDANMRVRSPYEGIEIGMLVDKLSKEFIVKCSACHNDYANGVIGPSLLDKDATYIFEKIRKFKTDPNANVLMTELVKQMSDVEIEKLANEIEDFNTKINEMRK